MNDSKSEIRLRHPAGLNINSLEDQHDGLLSPRNLKKPLTLKTRIYWRRLLHWGPIITLCLVFGLSIATISLVIPWNTLSGFQEIDIGAGFYALTDLQSIDANAFFPTCAQCRLPKPSRSHHCRKCGACILKMDHHCPWINNCVGFQNEHAFILFVSSACSTTLATCAWHLWRLVCDPRVQPHRAFIHLMSLFAKRVRHADVLVAQSFAHMTCALLALLVCIGTGCLLWGCVGSIVNNMTWLEELELEERAHRQRRPMAKCPYDAGLLANVRQFVGPSLLRFFFPVFIRSDCDYGTYYAITRGFSPEVLARPALSDSDSDDCSTSDSDDDRRPTSLSIHSAEESVQCRSHPSGMHQHHAQQVPSIPSSLPQPSNAIQLPPSIQLSTSIQSTSNAMPSSSNAIESSSNTTQPNHPIRNSIYTKKQQRNP